MSGSSGSAVAPIALTSTSQVSRPGPVSTRQTPAASSHALCSISQEKRMCGVTPCASAMCRTYSRISRWCGNKRDQFGLRAKEYE